MAYCGILFDLDVIVVFADLRSNGFVCLGVIEVIAYKLGNLPLCRICLMGNPVLCIFVNRGLGVI